MSRLLLSLACSTLLASACSAPHSPTAAAASGFGREQVGSPRRHTPGMASLRALGHRLPHEKLRPLAVPNVIGQTAEDPNKGPAGLTYNMGPMLESPEVYAVFWGQSVAPAIVAGMPPFFENAFGSATKLMTGISEYDATTPYTIGGVSYRGSYVDADAPMGTSHTISDLDIQIELTRLFDLGKLPPADGHSIFMIYFPPGLTIDQGGGTLSCDVFCAYHSSFMRNGGYVYYGVMPDETQGTCAQLCGADTPLNNEYSTSSHELIEATTDAAIGNNSLAWYDLVDSNDAIGGEVADICVNWGGTSNGYVVQTMWSNESNSCRAGKSTGFAQVAIDLDDVATPADVSGGAAATVTVPITLTVPATGGAAGPFTLATFLDSSMTPTFNPPALAGSGSATLTFSVPAGTHSQTLSFEVDAADADGAHHWGVGQAAVTGPAPTVTSYTPKSGPANGGTQVTVTGSNWGLGSTVTLCDPGCNTPVPGGYVAGTKGQTVRLTTPGHAAGAVTFQLANLNDAGHAQTIDFTYTAGAAPTIASTDPAAGPSAGGNLVVIDGANFSNNAIVSIDGSALVPLQSMEVVDDKTILVIMPAAKTGEAAPSIVVTNGDKSATAAYTGYAYTKYPNPAPTIASMSASMGPTTGGTYLELTGSFATPATVELGAAQAKLLTQSQSFLTMMTPAHAAGMVPVAVIASDSQKVSAAMSFTYVTSAAPSIASIAPGWGTTAGGTSVVLDGTSFDPNALVTFDGTPAPVVSGSNTSLTITTPAHAAGSVTVAVKNGDGQTASGTFLYSDTAPADMAVAPDIAMTAPDMSSGGHGGCAMAGGATPAGPMTLLFVAGLLALALRRRRPSCRAVLATSLIASIPMSAPRAAADDFTMCKDIRKGDIAACKTKVAIACTGRRLAAPQLRRKDRSELRRV